MKRQLVRALGRLCQTHRNIHQASGTGVLQLLVSALFEHDVQGVDVELLGEVASLIGLFAGGGVVVEEGVLGGSSNEGLGFKEQQGGTDLCTKLGQEMGVITPLVEK